MFLAGDFSNFRVIFSPVTGQNAVAYFAGMHGFVELGNGKDSFAASAGFKIEGCAVCASDVVKAGELKFDQLVIWG